MKIAMLGLGKLGLPVAESMSQHHTVNGYDINPNIKSDKISIKQSLWNCVKDQDVVFIAVSTPHDPDYGGEKPTSHLPVKDFDYTALKNILSSCKQYCDADTLIVLISTVLPNTLANCPEALALGDRLIYNPYLIAMGTVQHDFENPDIVMFGGQSRITSQQKDTLLSVYQPIWQTQPHQTWGTWQECECIKIFHNTYISAKIGIANMIQDVTNQIGNADPSIISESLKHARRVVGTEYMTPGMGDGGPCHPRDNIALSWLAENLNLGYDLFHAIMTSREQQAQLMAQQLMTYHLPIHILGKSFKPVTHLTDGSSSMLVAYYCEQQGHTVTWDTIGHEPAVYLLSHPYNNQKFPQGSIIVDPWRTCPKQPNCSVIYYGLKK